MRLSYILISALLFSPLAAEDAPQDVAPSLNTDQPFVINLKNPVFSQGVIQTDEGGIIEAENVRIQAQHIEYANRIENGIPVQRVVAEGDLLVEYGERIFVGKRLEYDFVSKTGLLLDGKTFVDIWFLGGDRIELKSDGSYFIYDAYITTCESQDHTWDIHAGMVRITDNYLLSAHNIRFRFSKFPVLWLPSFSSNLKSIADPPIRYKIKWDKGLGPRATMRYRILSKEAFNLFFRLDYRLKRGFGAALESEYYSPDERTTFLTKSYGAHDKSVPVERGNRRFRLQGLYQTHSVDNKTQVHLSYDRLSDDKMPGDFKSDDFEINTQKRTILRINHQEENILGRLTLQPRINPFQSLDQELPLIKIAARPFEIGNSGIIAENRVSAGFLDYVYDVHLHKHIHNIHAVRLETKNQIYRPIPIYRFTLTPRVGIIGIFYDNNQRHTPVGQAMLNYGAELNTGLYHQFSCHRHAIEPYINYQGFTRPTAALDDHYIFSIEDGYTRENIVRSGVRHALFSDSFSLFTPRFVNDTYTYVFIDDNHLHRTLPKFYTSFGWNLPYMAITTNFAWNAQERLWDYTNLKWDYTINENVAFGVEFRHRSKFDFRKADHENFLLNFARSNFDLLHSPLSDGRNTLLTRLQIRLTPRITCHLQSHQGWGRKNEPNYNAAKISFNTLLTCRWHLRLSYEHTPDDDRFTYGLSLMQ